MDELIQCRCGHGISNHTAGGCETVRLTRCRCRLTADDVLEQALRMVRTQYGQWSEPI